MIAEIERFVDLQCFFKVMKPYYDLFLNKNLSICLKKDGKLTIQIIISRIRQNRNDRLRHIKSTSFQIRTTQLFRHTFLISDLKYYPNS